MTVGTVVVMAIGTVIVPAALAGMDTVPVRARVGTIIARVQVIGMVIAAITTIAMAIVVIMMAGGIRWQLSALEQSSVVQSLSQHLSRFTALAIAMFSGAITATDHIALRTIRSSHIMVRASSAIRLTADRSRNPKKQPPQKGGCFHLQVRLYQDHICAISRRAGHSLQRRRLSFYDVSTVSGGQFAPHSSHPHRRLRSKHRHNVRVRKRDRVQ